MGGRPLMAVGAAAVAFAIGSSAGASITPSISATDVAAAMTQQPGLVTNAAFITKPPGGVTAAVADTPLTAFPTNGPNYAILSTGDATLASTPNTAADTSTSAGGQAVRGDSDTDVTILRLDLNVPQTANCLTFDFRFLSEEYPEFVGKEYNDAFIAELDTSDWTTNGSTISAPHNFAFDAAGSPISVNATGATGVSPLNAAGTTYDAATARLTATTPVTPGAHALYLSIFDQGDDLFDSSVFLDGLNAVAVPPESCKPGASVSGIAVEGVNGQVFITVKGKKQKLTRGTEIPNGATVDTSAAQSSVELEGKVGADTFSGAAFVVNKTTEVVRTTAARGADTKTVPLVDLHLTGGTFAVCKTRSVSAYSDTKPKPKPNTKVVRRLFGKGTGHYRTRGNYASATVRGTIWTTEDRCDGTWISVKQGVVEVNDFVKKTKVAVKAGHTYLAKKPGS